MTHPLAPWLPELVRDAGRWPINLVRDFPVRLGRLPFHPVHFQGGIGSFLLRLVSAVFDLAGGPELFEFSLRALTNTSSLTRQEVDRVVSVFGPTAVRTSQVRLAEGGILKPVFRLNGNLAFTLWRTVCLPKNSRLNSSIFIHELAHVAQFEQVGSRYLGEAVLVLIQTKRNCYHYGGPAGLRAALKAGRTFQSFNREQQAMILQDFFILSEQGSDVSDYFPFVDQARSGKM